MNPELLAAYHYLSSAIAQAFAALITLTAMFYIYRRQLLNNQIKDVVNEGISLLAALHARRSDGTVVYGDQKIDILMNRMKFSNEPSIIEQIKKVCDTSEGQIEYMGILIPIKLGACSILRKHERLVRLKEIYTVLSIFSIILSSIATASGIFCLRLGYGLCVNQQLAFMTGETVIAGVALLFVVTTVITMLLGTKLYKTGEEFMNDLKRRFKSLEPYFNKESQSESKQK